MSLLREIMGRLSHRRGGPPPRASAADAAGPGGKQAYGERITCATDAELLYEWAWIEQRLAALATTAAEERHQLLAWRQQLMAACELRSLSPLKPRGTVDLQHHAWELVDPALRRAWRLG